MKSLVFDAGRTSPTQGMFVALDNDFLGEPVRGQSRRYLRAGFGSAKCLLPWQFSHLEI